MGTLPKHLYNIFLLDLIVRNKTSIKIAELESFKPNHSQKAKLIQSHSSFVFQKQSFMTDILACLNIH